MSLGDLSPQSSTNVKRLEEGSSSYRNMQQLQNSFCDSNYTSTSVIVKQDTFVRKETTIKNLGFIHDNGSDFESDSDDYDAMSETEVIRVKEFKR